MTEIVEDDLSLFQIPPLTEEEIEYRNKTLRTVIADDPVRRIRHCVLQKAFHTWAQTFPLAQTNGELTKQLQERIKALQTLRESYLRDVISIKFHLEKLTETAILSRDVVRDIAGIPSTNISAMIERVKETPNQSSTQLRECLMKAGLINPYTGEALNPWESSRCFKSYKKFEKGAKYKMPTGGTSIHLHAPHSHKLYIRYCKSCVGMMSLVYEWNEEVEQALISWRASVDKEYEAEKQKKVKALIEKLNTAIYEKEEENARLNARLHLVESANQWYETWQYGLQAKQTTEQLEDQIRMLKNQTGMGRAEKESMDFNNADRVTRAMADHVTREKKMKSTLENTLQRLEDERIAKDRLNAQMEIATNEVQSQEEAMAYYKENNIKLTEQVKIMNIRWEHDQASYRELLLAMEKKEKDMLEYQATATRQSEEYQQTIEGLTSDYDANEHTIDNLRDTNRALKRNLAISEQHLVEEKRKVIDLESSFKRDRKNWNKELSQSEASRRSSVAASSGDHLGLMMGNVVENAMCSPLMVHKEKEKGTGSGPVSARLGDPMKYPTTPGGEVTYSTAGTANGYGANEEVDSSSYLGPISSSLDGPGAGVRKWTLKKVAKFVIHSIRNVSKDNTFLYNELVKNVPRFREMDEVFREERRQSSRMGTAPPRRNYKRFLSNDEIRLPSHSETIMNSDALNVAEGRIVELEQDLKRLRVVCVQHQVQAQLQRSLAVQLRDCLFTLRAKFHLTTIGLQQQESGDVPLSAQYDGYSALSVLKDVFTAVRTFMKDDKGSDQIRPIHATAFNLKTVCGDTDSLLRAELKKNPPKFVVSNANHLIPKLDDSYNNFFSEGYTPIAEHFREEDSQVKSLCTAMYKDLYEIERSQLKLRLRQERETNVIAIELDQRSQALQRAIEKSHSLVTKLSDSNNELKILSLKCEKLEKKVMLAKGKKRPTKPNRSPSVKAGSNNSSRMSLSQRTKASLGKLNKEDSGRFSPGKNGSKDGIVVAEDADGAEVDVEEVARRELLEEEAAEALEAEKRKKKNDDRQASLNKHSLYSMNNASFKNRRTPAVSYVTVKAEKLDSDDETESDCEVVDLTYDEDWDDDESGFCHELTFSYLKWKLLICTMLTVADDMHDDAIFGIKLKDHFNGTVESLLSDGKELAIFRENEPYLQSDIQSYRMQLQESEHTNRVNDSIIHQLRTDYAQIEGENKILRSTVEESYRTITTEVTKKIEAHAADVLIHRERKVANQRHRGTQVACSVCDIRQRFEKCQPVQNLGQGMLTSIDASTGYLRVTPSSGNEHEGSCFAPLASTAYSENDDVILVAHARDIRGVSHRPDNGSKHVRAVYPGMQNTIEGHISEELSADLHHENSAFERFNVSNPVVVGGAEFDMDTSNIEISKSTLHLNQQRFTYQKGVEGYGGAAGQANKRRPLSANVCGVRKGSSTATPTVTKFSSLRNIPIYSASPSASPPTLPRDTNAVMKTRPLSGSLTRRSDRPLSGSLTRRSERPTSGSVTRRGDRPSSGKSNSKFTISPQLPHCISATSAASYGHDAAGQSRRNSNSGPLLTGKALSPSTIQRLERAAEASLLQHTLVHRIGMTNNIIEDDVPLVNDLVAQREARAPHTRPVSPIEYSS